MLAGSALAVLGVVGAIILAILFLGPSAGKEIARHTHEGQRYVLVEYGNDLAIFADSGQPVTRRGLAEDILYSYAWRQAIGDFDIGRLADVSAKVRKLDDSLSDIRDFSNDVVYILDELESLDADIPLLGRISAMDVIRESFDGVSEAEELIRSLNSELNALGDNTDTLSRASDWVAELELSSVSGAEARSLFSDAAPAALELESSVQSIKDGVSDTRDAVAGLENALWSASDTPMIGDTMGHHG